MKRRAAALALCLLLMLLPAPARAAGAVYFTAAGNDILPMSDETMPFWANGYLYVAVTIFTGQVNRSLGVAYLPYTASDVAILYSGGRSLTFRQGQNLTEDSDGELYYPGGIWRDGHVFVPASLVAEFFGLDYSVTPLRDGAVGEGVYGSLVWLRKPNFGLSDKYFANAATSQMIEAYAQYRRSLEPPPSPPAEEPPEEPPEEPAEGKTLYLCLEAGEDAASLLDILDSHGARASFLCGQDFLERHGDLLRRMTATGHAVILRGGGLQALEAGERALERATFGKTRLVLAEGEDDVRAAAEAGLCRVGTDLSGYGLTGRSSAELLLQRASSLRGDVRILLDGTVTAAGLRAFLERAGQAGDRCAALTETTA